MFESRNVPCYLERMGHKTLKVGKEKYKGTEIVLRVDPFTPALASELAETKGVIFRRTEGAEPNPNIDAVSFTYQPKPQRISITAEPTIKASVVIAEAKVTKFRVRKPSDGTQWVLVFRIIFTEVGGNDLLWLKEALFEQRFFTFEPAAAGLFDDADKEAARESAAAKPVRPSASTH